MENDDFVLLRNIARFEDQANWYKVGRIALGELENPGRFTELMRALIEGGLVHEGEGVGDGLRPLKITARGLKVLAEYEEESKQRR